MLTRYFASWRVPPVFILPTDRYTSEGVCTLDSLVVITKQIESIVLVKWMCHSIYLKGNSFTRHYVKIKYRNVMYSTGSWTREKVFKICMESLTLTPNGYSEIATLHIQHTLYWIICSKLRHHILAAWLLCLQQIHARANQMFANKMGSSHKGIYIAHSFSFSN